MTLGWARTWLLLHSHLTTTNRNGWPVLVLTFEAEPPTHVSRTVLQNHYQRAAKAGPIADLANALEVQP